MIRCYYTKEALDTVAKTRQRRIFFAKILSYVFAAAGLFVTFALEFRFPDVPVTLGFLACFGGMLYFAHWHALKFEDLIMQHADDEITLNDDEIRMSKADGTQISLARHGLIVESSGTTVPVFKIRNPGIISNSEIVLVSIMENTKELVETIQPGIWYYRTGA
jgi:hypothetical protein